MDLDLPRAASPTTQLQCVGKDQTNDSQAHTTTVVEELGHTYQVKSPEKWQGGKKRKEVKRVWNHVYI